MHINEKSIVLSAVDNIKSDDGIGKISIFAELGIDKKKRFRTVWQNDTPAQQMFLLG